MRILRTLGIGSFSLLSALTQAGDARACGCFAPPNPTVSVVQAGEQIVFAADGQNVIAHIKIQYSGDAKDFGWLVPLPSVPKVGLSTDELFSLVEDRTQPRYQLKTVREACQGKAGSTSESSGIGCGSGSQAGGNFATPTAGSMDMMEMSPNPALVAQDSIGPYDYAILKADDKTAMVDWLDKNHYYVPVTGTDVIGPYLHPGAYFLALKLKAGRGAGDIQPVQLTYPSDLPMIPIVLTSVGATPNMGIQVFVAGRSRAIPRNYYHTVLDDMNVGWSGGTIDYQGMIVAAVHEAPKHHTFVTEYAGPSSVMDQALDPTGRFANQAALAGIKNPIDAVEFLFQGKYPLTSAMYGILERYVPAPPEVISAGITPALFYARIRYYLETWLPGHAQPVDGGAPPAAFDPVAFAGEIDMRIVQPTLAAARMFHDHAVLTRLYTALSPEDMTEDPVFSFNDTLPDVPALHEATVTFPCGGQSFLTVQGFEAPFVAGSTGPVAAGLPASLQIQALREAGPPQIITDNTAAIQAKLPKVNHGSASASSAGAGGSSPSVGCGGCTVLPSPTTRNELITLACLAGAVLATRRRRRA